MHYTHTTLINCHDLQRELVKSIWRLAGGLDQFYDLYLDFRGGTILLIIRKRKSQKFFWQFERGKKVRVKILGGGHWSVFIH